LETEINFHQKMVNISYITLTLVQRYFEKIKRLDYYKTMACIHYNRLERTL